MSDSDDDNPAKRFLKEQREQQLKQIQLNKQAKKKSSNTNNNNNNNNSKLQLDAFGEPLSASFSTSKGVKRKADGDDNSDDGGGDDYTDNYKDGGDDDDDEENFDNDTYDANGLILNKKLRMDTSTASNAADNNNNNSNNNNSNSKKQRPLGPNGRPLQPYEIPKQMDTSKILRQVWLVKVPEYFLQGLEKLDDGTIIGNTQIPTSKPTSQITMPVNITVNLIDDNNFAIPHKFDLKPQTSTTAATSVFSESEDGNLAFEGTSIQRCDLIPQLNPDYSRYMREKREKASIPKLQTTHTETIKNEFIPISEHAADKEQRLARKNQDKRERMDRDELKNQLASIFEKYEYAGLDKLQQITNQPATWLKEVLSELCDYNNRGPHKNTYQLKPEYAHMKH